MKHLSICNFGDCLGVSGNRLTVRSKEGELQEYCLTHLRSICIAKNGISISSNLVQACAARGIRLYFLDWTGKSTACISGEHQHAVVQVRKAQFRAIESVLSHFLSRGECQDFCVWGGYSRGSPTRLPFVFEMQYARPDAIAGAKVEGPARSAGGSSLAPAIARREAAGALAREV